MSNKQLESFIAKAQFNENIKRQAIDCGTDKICVSEVGVKYGHKFSPANVGHWERDHDGALLN